MKDNTIDLATEKFLYYFMGLRKGDLCKQVETLQSRYPSETPEMLARRFIKAQVPLSAVGSVLIHAPMMLPTVGALVRCLGLASGTTVMMILNMTLFMQIALLYGYDIDDRARLKELLAVVAATGAGSGSTLLLPQLAGLAPGPKAVTGSVAIMTASQLVGEYAIRYFNRKAAAKTAVQPA